MRKQIDKKQWKILVWSITVIGLILNGITGTLFIYSKVSEYQMRLGFWMAVSLLITGFGLGLAYSRMWKIKGFDDLNSEE